MIFIGEHKLHYGSPQQRWLGALTSKRLMLEQTEGVGGLPVSVR